MRLLVLSKVLSCAHFLVTDEGRAEGRGSPPAVARRLLPIDTVARIYDDFTAEDLTSQPR
jgi:hypothetical protein